MQSDNLTNGRLNEQDDLAALGGYKTKQALAYDALREAIITCRFPPGKRLMEVELAQQLGISRSPVREALKRLSHEGLVTEIPHLGVTVSEVGLESLHELYLILGALEGLACREAAQLRSEASVRALERELQAMERAMLADDYQVWVQHNRDFHAYARKDCALPQLLRMLGDTQDRIHRFHVFQGAATTRARLSEPEHAAIFKAICDRDGDATERLVRAHYMEGERVFKKYLLTISEDR